MTQAAETEAVESTATAQRSGHQELDPSRTLLRQVALFSELDEAAIGELARRGRLSDHVPGDRIVSRGDAGGTLLVVESGVAEVVLERPSGEHVRLQELKRTEYFGELSLFDGQPRSATVVALTRCRILELDREAVLDKLDKAGLQKLLVNIAARVRRTDGTVSELADKVYRAAYANVHAAVSVELETIKTLYQRTELRANHTLEQAQQCARVAVERADGVVAQIERRLDGIWSRFKTWVLPVVGVLGMALAALGIHSYLDLRKKYDEAIGWHDAMGKLHEKMIEADKTLRVVGETETALRGAREAAYLQQPAATPAELRRAAQGFEHAKDELLARYLRARDGTPRFDQYEPEVVFEAVDTFVTMASWGRTDGRPALSGGERKLLIQALLYVLRSSHESGAESAIAPRLPFDHKLRDALYLLAEGAQRAPLLAALEELTSHPPNPRAGDNAALILASLGHDSPTVLKALRQNLEDPNPWDSAASAHALAKFRDRQAWGQIKQQLEDDARRYPIATLLAQEGPGSIRRLAQSFRDAGAQGTILQQTRDAIERHVPRNCYEQRYDHWLLACLDGDCGRRAAFGGDCTLSGN